MWMRFQHTDQKWINRLNTIKAMGFKDRKDIKHVKLKKEGFKLDNKSPLMTPFRSGFPIDTIPSIEMSPEDRAPLIAKMQSWLGMLNWLQMCTRPDLATIFSLLVSYMHCPSPGHIDAVKHVGKYILSIMEMGLHFSSKPNSTLESYIHFSLSDDDSLSLSTSPSLNSFSMQTGVLRMHPNPLPLTYDLSQLRKHDLSAVTFCSWGDVLFFGKLIRRLRLVGAPVKQRSKLQMNV
jgi:hypothetical protein